jgi:peptide/nickel transport system permease protein
MNTIEPTGRMAGLEPTTAADRRALVPDEEQEQISVASPRQLMWWKFRKHRMAVISGIVLIILYMSALFADFISPYDPLEYDAGYKFVPPMHITFINAAGHFTLRPGVHGLISNRNPETLRITYTVDKSTWYPIHFLSRANPTSFWG